MTQYRSQSSTTASGYRLVNELNKDIDPACLIPIKKYVSDLTGMKLYVCEIDGPVIEGCFTLATEATDDDGLPHTLEHMIFLGSRSYPYAGIMDILANKVYAPGTNAWTDVDNTTYTISTIEKHGFLQLLPIYLDHIFFPLLKESGFITEVYHLNGEGEDGGVVYSEMQSVENEDETVVERAMHRAIYPNEDCGYRYETGGMLHNLRTSTSHVKVRDYHAKMYKPDNMAIIVAGKISAEEILDVLHEFERKTLLNQEEKKLLKLDERPFQRPIMELSENVEQVVYFPTDQEQNSNGIVSIGWRGPSISQVRELVALDLLLAYLTESSISPIYEHFIETKSYCNKLSYQVQEYRETYLTISFTNTQLDKLEKIKPELFQILSDLKSGKQSFDLNRMRSMIKMKIHELKDKFEDSPHDTISRICIGDFLYGNSDDPVDFNRRFTQTHQFESLIGESEHYWLNLIEKYFLSSFSVTVIAKPSEKLMNSIGEENRIRVDERKNRLGKKGLKELKVALENAIEENDDFEIPDELYEQIKSPSLENLQLRSIKQYFSYDQKSCDDFEPIKSGFKSFQNLKHLQMQVDHLEGTNFAQVYLLIDTQNLSVELRSYLQLFINLFFELPINDGDQVNLTHQQAVYEISKELLEFEASLGINGSEFEPGIYPNYACIFIKVPVNDYALAVKWLKLVVFNSVFDEHQVKTACSNLLKEITKRKQQPHDILTSLVKDINYYHDASVRLNGFLRQEAFLKNIEEKLASDLKQQVLDDLERLRADLLKEEHLRFYMCADLVQLYSKNKNLDAIWTEKFPNKSDLISKPYKVKQTWDLKRDYQKNLAEAKSNQASVWSQLPKNDFIVGLGSTESSFVRLTTTTEINTYHHPDYAGLLVLLEYFTQTEGPLWESVRGPGYCYHESMSLNPETAQLDLFIDECSHLVKAFEATKEIIFSHNSEKRSNFDAQLLETAKNSLIFSLIDELKSVSSYSAYSMSTLFKGVDLEAVPELIKRIEKIDLKVLRKLLKTYVLPLFDPEQSNCVIICHPSKTETITSSFSQTFNRELNVIGKVDECLCAVESI